MSMLCYVVGLMDNAGDDESGDDLDELNGDQRGALQRPLHARQRPAGTLSAV